MALYEDYFNQNNLYSRPSEMMSGVNNYLGANRAQLPQSQDSLGSMMGPSLKASDDDNGIGIGIGDGIDDIDDDRGGKDIKTPWFAEPAEPGDEGPGANIYGQGRDLTAKFISELSVLDSDQQGLLLKFIGSDGVSPEEYAELFGVDDEYANRFQGFPNLLNIGEQIENVYASGEQQMGFEQKAAQQAQIAQKLSTSAGGRGFGGFGRGGSNALSRRTLMDTLNQRRESARESTANKYAQLIASVQSKLGSGFAAASNILQENPGATFGNEANIEVGDIREASDGTYEYWDGSAYVDRETYFRNQDDRGQG
tara:strand:+ start:254 stop:1186 length:933 start_codon:yes stop_codon:yes gene_type:complete